ncbi:MAG: outer membrane lipoprotein carrier protein LolA [Treponema sp.]|nr:outer membrane lipoprotein carrier protein LolA [Treponema sp.]MBQ2552062.1 outer membrane lipoprotein carrier protein LolA [Treponema sp.]MBQ4235242.1 outer membrane lipoprotein carrier protein LolA [Treponema sp.]MBQ5384072.1 outer membrane lipoprotein carrier protein LolA [Treponema sp.]
MNRKHFIAITAMIILAAAAVSAQNATVESVCKSLTAHAVTTGSFTQEKKIANARRSLKSSGTFLFSGKLVIWDTVKPVASSLIVTNDKIIQKSPDGKTSVMSGKDNEAFKGISQSVTALFSGDKSALEKNFNIAFTSTASTWQMVLTPKDKTVASVMKTITVSGTGNSRTSVFTNLIVEQLDGGTINYTFTDHKYKEELSDAEKALINTAK